MGWLATLFATSARAEEGSAEFKPQGITGPITIKMMSITSKTSISGVTLISEERPAPPEVPFVENAIAVFSQCKNWASEHSIV
jgi:hypothetical protein